VQVGAMRPGSPKSQWVDFMRAEKGIVKAIFIILLAGIVIQILFDPLSNFFLLGESLQARIGLPAARKKWESQGITHYTFDIQGYIPLVCIFGGNIEVQDETIVRISERSDDQLSPGLKTLIDPPLCNYQIYTMPLLFDELERWLRKSPFSISQISFDPQYGFISSFGFGNCDGRGLLNPVVSDCNGGFTIENFQVLGE